MVTLNTYLAYDHAIHCLKNNLPVGALSIASMFGITPTSAESIMRHAEHGVPSKFVPAGLKPKAKITSPEIAAKETADRHCVQIPRSKARR